MDRKKQPTLQNTLLPPEEPVYTDIASPVLTDAQRTERREKRIAARKQRERARRAAFVRRAIPVILLFLAAVTGLLWWGLQGRSEDDALASNIQPPETEDIQPFDPSPKPQEAAVVSVVPTVTDRTIAIGEEIASQYVTLIDADSWEVIACRSENTLMNPASMTKVLTILTASEALKLRDFSKDTVTIDLTITDFCFSNGCSVAGFLLNEVVPVEDLFYATILPSGADGALALAIYTAGSHEAFVALMNEEARILGLSEGAGFTNCVGIYDKDNTCTATDMAIIMRAALQDPLCRKVLCSRIYETVPTELQPDGQILSNWFIRKIEDKDTGSVTVRGAKTGYVVQSGNCAVSYAEAADGHPYICVTGDAPGGWACIRDHVALYHDYLPT